jgi:hypothetical protein
MEDSCKVCRYILVGLVRMLSLPCWWRCYGWAILKHAYAAPLFTLRPSWYGPLTYDPPTYKNGS